MEHVSRASTCKRCDSTTVTWQKSTAGKWYLTEVFKYPVRLPNADDSDEMTDYRDFHSKYCGKPEKHKVKQDQIIADFIAWEAEHERKELDAQKRSDEREAQRIEDEADKLAAFLRMSLAERARFLVTLDARLKASVQGTTMDYMTEYLKAVTEHDAIQAEIDMYADFMEDVEE